LKETSRPANCSCGVTLRNAAPPRSKPVVAGGGGIGVGVGWGVAVGTGAGVVVGSGVAVGCGVTVGGTGVGAADVNVGTGVAVGSGGEVGSGGKAVVSGRGWLSVTAVGQAVVGTNARASWPPDRLQAAKAITRAAKIEHAAASLIASWPCLPERGSRCAPPT
jgi:hypothetical protein